MIDEPVHRLDEGALRALVPGCSRAWSAGAWTSTPPRPRSRRRCSRRSWSDEHPPHDPRAWLTTIATRRLVDARRSESARHRREETTYPEPRPATTEEGDDTLFLLFCCCHPDLAPASQGGAECGDEPIIVSQCVAVPGLRDHRVPDCGLGI